MKLYRMIFSFRLRLYHFLCRLFLFHAAAAEYIAAAVFDSQPFQPAEAASLSCTPPPPAERHSIERRDYAIDSCRRLSRRQRHITPAHYFSRSSRRQLMSRLWQMPRVTLASAAIRFTLADAEMSDDMPKLPALHAPRRRR